MYDQRTFAVINKKQLANNISNVKRRLTQGTKLMAVVKADGYGHGISQVSEVFDQDADWFAVATFEEAKKIRQQKIAKPILILGYVPYSNIVEAAQLNLTVSGFSKAYVWHVNHICQEQQIKLSMHLKVDTGFNRLGMKVNQTEFMDYLEYYKLEAINFTGIYTHFSSATQDNQRDIEFTKNQYYQFKNLCDSLTKNDIEIGIRHCCNSKAMLYFPEMHLDMVRVGVYLYGLASPKEARELSLGLAIKWQARLILIKEIKLGESVSYGRTFTAKNDMKIGIISVGFGDGFFRSLGNNTGTTVQIAGCQAEILGKICMDFMIVDLTNIENAIEGMTAEIIGTKNDPYFLGKKIQSTGGELITSINERVPKIYIEK